MSTGARRAQGSTPQKSKKSGRGALTPRLQRQQAEIAAALPLADASQENLRGMLWGMKLAMQAMYPDADSFVGQEPSATKLILTYRAIEDALENKDAS